MLHLNSLWLAKNKMTLYLGMQNLKQQFLLRDDITYLNFGSFGACPKPVFEKYQQFQLELEQEPVQFITVNGLKYLETSREALGSYLNCHKDDLVYVTNPSYAVNAVARSFDLKPGDEILTTNLEYGACDKAWEYYCKKTGAVYIKQPISLPVKSKDEFVADFFKAVSSKTKLVSIVHVSNSMGTVNPIKKIVELAHKAGAVVLVDGAQSAVHLDIDVQDMDCDFFVFSAHKLFGPTGTGVLYGKRKILEDMPPFLGGGEMIKEVSFESTTYADLPYKFEAGTPNIADTVAFKSAIDFINALGKKEIRKHEESLLAYATAELEKLPGLTIIGKAKEKVSVVSFVIENIHSQDTGILLDNRGIAVRTGHHCTQPLMRRFGIAGTTRASFAVYNTMEEVDALIFGLKKAIKILS